MKKCSLIYIILIFSLGSCHKWIDEKESSALSFSDFESSWQAVDSVYPDFNLKGIVWDDIYDKYESEAKGASGDEITRLIIRMLAELRDGHVKLKTRGGEQIYPYIPPRRIRDMELFDPRVIRNYFDNGLTITGIAGIEYGINSDGIGYMNITSFGSHIDFINSINSIIGTMQSTKGLIIDVRHNKGGNGIEVLRTVSHFLTDTIPDLQSYVLREKHEQGIIIPSEGNIYLKPVVILINGVTYSAAESFAEIMKQLDQVIVVGDTTGGGAFGYYGNTGPASGNFSLPGGMELHVGTMNLIRYDGLSFEGIGIAPDIRIINSPEALSSGIDSQLAWGLDHLRDLQTQNP